MTKETIDFEIEFESFVFAAWGLQTLIIIQGVCFLDAGSPLFSHLLICCAVSMKHQSSISAQDKMQIKISR